jgi:hypothetical protein
LNSWAATDYAPRRADIAFLLLRRSRKMCAAGS